MHPVEHAKMDSYAEQVLNLRTHPTDTNHLQIGMEDVQEVTSAKEEIFHLDHAKWAHITLMKVKAIVFHALQVNIARQKDYLALLDCVLKLIYVLSGTQARWGKVSSAIQGMDTAQRVQLITRTAEMANT